MARHAAFLKGMNLGGRRISNQDLRTAVESLGLAEVETFRASGNVIFEAGRRSEASLCKLLEDGLREQLGYEVAVFVRGGAELSAILAAEPFSATELKGAGKPQVALLTKKPSAGARKKVLALDSERDRLRFGARELFWLPAGGMSESDLDWKAIAGALGAATVRTFGTIEQIASRWFQRA